MKTEHTAPGNNRDNDQWKKEQELHNSRTNDTEKQNISGDSKNPKVLHKDGSLADLPDQDVPGTGALDGTVGLGT